MRKDRAEGAAFSRGGRHIRDLPRPTRGLVTRPALDAAVLLSKPRSPSPVSIPFSFPVSVPFPFPFSFPLPVSFSFPFPSGSVSGLTPNRPMGFEETVIVSDDLVPPPMKPKGALPVHMPKLI